MSKLSNLCSEIKTTTHELRKAVVQKGDKYYESLDCSFNLKENVLFPLNLFLKNTTDFLTQESFIDFVHIPRAAE